MNDSIDDSRNDPQIWKASCLQLLDSLTVIERGLLNSSRVEEHSATQVAMMLAGYAFENAFKFRHLMNGHQLYMSDKLQKFKTHSFTAWIHEYQIETKGWELEALDRAEFFSVAWGRYPAHNRKEKERRMETSSWGDIGQIRNLITRLLEQGMA
jgi:hypothetical protein